jgi:hypothetical protein
MMQDNCTFLPAYDFEEALNVVLSPEEIGRITHNVKIRQGPLGPLGPTAIDLTGDLGIPHIVPRSTTTPDGTDHVVDHTFRDAEECNQLRTRFCNLVRDHPEAGEFVVQCDGGAHLYPHFVAASMLVYAVLGCRCVKVSIVDPSHRHISQFSKGYALRSWACENKPCGLSPHQVISGSNMHKVYSRSRFPHNHGVLSTKRGYEWV